MGYPVQRGSPDLWTKNKLLQGGIPPQKIILRIWTGHIPPQYHVLFYDTGAHEEGHSTRKLEKSGRGALRYHLIFQKRGISKNTKAYPCLRRTVKRTHRSQVPNNYPQGTITRLHLVAWHKSLSDHKEHRLEKRL